MSAPESTATATSTSPDFTGLAIAVGRIEEGQKNLQGSVNRVEGKVDGVAETVASHSVKIAALETKVDARAPIRVPWTSVAAFVFGLAATTAAVIAIFKP